LFIYFLSSQDKRDGRNPRKTKFRIK